jgi:hypothetical protein
MKFSIAHATARPKGWQAAFDRVVSNAAYPGKVEYVLSVDERFGEFERYAHHTLKFVTLDPSERKCAVSNWLNALKHTTGDVIIINSDDFSFPFGWDVGLTEAIGDRDPQKRPFVIQVSTGNLRDDKLMTIQIFSRALLNHWGYALWHEYDGLYSDDDFTEHAFLDQEVEVIPAFHLLFEHLHFTFGKSQKDEVYEHENRPEGSSLGLQIIQKRRAANFQ